MYNFEFNKKYKFSKELFIEKESDFLKYEWIEKVNNFEFIADEKKGDERKQKVQIEDKGKIFSFVLWDIWCKKIN